MPSWTVKIPADESWNVRWMADCPSMDDLYPRLATRMERYPHVVSWAMMSTETRKEAQERAKALTTHRGEGCNAGLLYSYIYIYIYLFIFMYVYIYIYIYTIFSP